MGFGWCRSAAAAMVTALGLTAGPGLSHAASIVQAFDYNFANDHRTVTVGPNDSTSASNTQISRSMVFDQFDASLGTLQGVSFTISAGGTRIIGVTHNGGGPGTISFNITNRFGFNLGGVAEAWSTLPVAQTWDAWDLASGGEYRGISQNLNILSAVNQTIDFTAGEFSSFIGGGVLNLLIYSLNLVESLNVSGDGLVATAVAGSCNPVCGNNWSWAGPIAGSVSLTYTYEALAEVPEPATLALLGGGLAGLVLVRRRRCRQA